MRILINAPKGNQEVIDVGEGGDYSDKSAILWHEGRDGKIPKITLGGMLRVGKTLSFDQARKDLHDASIRTYANAKSNLRINSEAAVLIADIFPELIDAMSKLPGATASLKGKAAAINVKLAELK